eukprot:Rmarinus@m.7064
MWTKEARAHIDVCVCDDGNSVTDAVHQWLIPIACKRIEETSRFCVALSGGSSLKVVANALQNASAAGEDLHLTKWLFYFADERHVPLTDPDSNFRAAKISLFDPLGVNVDAQVRTVDPNVSTNDAAMAYAEQMRKDDIRQFDLVLLGVGEDGHVASLFPSHPVFLQCLHDTSSTSQLPSVYPVHDSPKPPPTRVTLSLGTINAAHHIGVIATGKGKREPLAFLSATASTDAGVGAGGSSTLGAIAGAGAGASSVGAIDAVLPVSRVGSGASGQVCFFVDRVAIGK